MAQAWRSEDSSREPILSFHCWRLGIKIRPLGIAASSFIHGAISPAWEFLIPFSHRVLIVEPGLELISCCCSFQNSLNYRTILPQTEAQRHQVIFLGFHRKHLIELDMNPDLLNRKPIFMALHHAHSVPNGTRRGKKAASTHSRTV